MKILITGAGGFIGAYVAGRLLDAGHDVLGLIRSESWRVRICSNIKFQVCDLNDREHLSDTIESFRPEVVLHFACGGTSSVEKANTDKIVQTNIVGTANLLQACQKASVRKIVLTGSMFEYGAGVGAHTESESLSPLDIYSATKGAATLLGLAFAHETSTPVIILRLFNVYGPFESPNRLITALLLGGLTGEPIPLGDGLERRDFIYVGDVLRAVECSLHSNVNTGVYNVGTGKETSIREVANLANSLFDGKLVLQFNALQNRTRFRMMSCLADTNLSKAGLGFEAKTSLLTGMQETREWLTAFSQSAKVLKSA